MRAVVQRVDSASVTVLDGETARETGRIGIGLLVLLGVDAGYGPADAHYIASKIRELRIFRDPVDTHKHMNLAVTDVGGAVLVVSQFTLQGDCRSGRR